MYYSPKKAFREDAIFINIYTLFFPSLKENVFLVGRSVVCELPSFSFVRSRWGKRLALTLTGRWFGCAKTKTRLTLENLLKIWHLATNQTNTTSRGNQNERSVEFSPHRKKRFSMTIYSYLQKIQFKKMVMLWGAENWTNIIYLFFFIWCLIRPYKPSKMFPTDNKHYAGERKKKKTRKISTSLHF